MKMRACYEGGWHVGSVLRERTRCMWEGCEDNGDAGGLNHVVFPSKDAEGIANTLVDCLTRWYSITLFKERTA